jgi:hypothetical protein
MYWTDGPGHRQGTVAVLIMKHLGSHVSNTSDFGLLKIMGFKSRRTTFVYSYGYQFHVPLQSSQMMTRI